MIKVKDLIKKLEKYDSEIEVLGYTEDQSIINDSNQLFRFLNISEEIDDAHCEFDRDEKGQVVAKFRKSEISRKVVFINISTDM